MEMQENEIAEIEIPEIEDTKRKGIASFIPKDKNGKKKWWAAAGILAACFLFLAGGAAAALKWYNKPQRRLYKGFAVLAEEVLEVEGIWQQQTGGSLSEIMDKGELTTVMNVSGEGLPITLGMDTKTQRDIEAKKLRTTLNISVSNTDLAEFTVYGDEKQIVAAMPDFWWQNLSFGTTHIEKQYNQSMWAEIFGKADEKEISIDLFSDRAQKEEKSKVQEIIQELREQWQNRKDISIEKTEEENQYRIVLPKEMLTESDLVCLVTLGKKNHIQKIEIENLSILSDSVNTPITLSGSVSFRGEERSIDDIYVILEQKLPVEACIKNQKLKDMLQKFGNKSGTDDMIEIVTYMNLTFHENDMCVCADFEELTITVDRIGTYTIRGTIQAEPLSEQIEPLKGETIPLFEMTQEEYEDLEKQLIDNISMWTRVLE